MTVQQSNNSVAKPLVSVIMNCYNGEKYLKEAIDSVYAQTYKNWEIIFWDNASTDSSAEIAQSYDGRLRYFRGEETIPLYGARNKALEQVRGEFITFLDCDDLWIPEKLEKQIPLFDDAEVGLVYSDVIHFNSSGDEWRIFDTMPFCTGWCFDELLRFYFLSLPSVVIRKATLDQETEWFDPQFNHVGDYDLFIRIAYSSKLDMCREVLARYRVHKSATSWRREDMICREQISLIDKYGRLWPDCFPKHTTQMRTQINFRKASCLWRNRRPKEARAALFPYVFRSFKAFVMYFASYFPPAKVYSILDRFRKVVRPEGFLSDENEA